MNVHAPALFPDETLASARALFPYLAGGRLYMNHAGTSPLSTTVVAAMSGYLRRRSEGMLDTYTDDCTMVDRCRGAIARLVHAASADRIAFQVNTSDAINVLASGLSWTSGDRIVLGAIEFPANVYPWLNLRSQGVEIDFLTAPDGRITTEMIAAKLTARTRLVALSAVQFLSGFRADLRSTGALCRSRGIVFAVDGIQAVGAIDLDVQSDNIDFLAAGAQKWQMGPHGTGFLYLTEELQSRVRQKYLGWLSVEDPWSFYTYDQAMASSARRYEGGSLNMPSLWGLDASIGTLLEYGPARIASHILAVTGELMRRLGRIDGVSLLTPPASDERAGIVSIALDSRLSAARVYDRLVARGLTIAAREGKLRYSPHFCNSIGDVRLAADLTEECIREG